MVAIDVDLSARKRAEESEKRLSDTLDSISDGFLTLSRDWTFTYVNAHAAEMLGRPRSELLLQPFLAVFPASASSPFHEACERAMAAGERVPFSDHSPRLGRWFEGSASPHPDGVAVYFRDVSAKHDAEEALHRSNEQLRLTMDAAHVGTWEWDRATDRMTLSEGIEAILGLPEGAFLETFRGGLATVHPDDRQRVQELAQRSGETGEPLTVEYRHLLSNGLTRWLAAQGNVIRDEAGAVTGMTGTIADVTGHRTVEQALRKSEASLSEAQRIARLGHWDWDVVTGSLWWSDEIYRIFGLHSQEFAATYSAFLERIHPADRQAVEDRVAQALNREELYEIDHRIVLPGGEERSVHEKGEVTFDESGAPIRMTGTVQDVTEARQVEAALRRQKELLSTVVGGAPLVIFATDREGVFTLSDGKALALIGLQPGEAVGQSAFVMFRDAPGVAENLRRALAGETVTFSSTLGELTFEALYAPLYDGSGQVDGVIGVALDTTERARLQEQLLHSQKMEGIGRLAGGVAHDFNNLLTAIISYSEFVAASFAPQDERRDDILEVLKAANRAAELTRQLLSFARRQMVEPKVVSVNDLMLGTDRLLRRLLGEDVELVTVPHAGVPEVEIDPGQFEQMLVNLAVNARDAMPEGGTLTMETGRALLEGRDAVRADLPAGRYVTLAVSDTGTGIAEEIREQIFEPFFTTKELGKGTGLGLATCYGIARQAGGTILVSSEVGKGTTFTIYLPVASGARRQPGEAGEQPALQGSETLLLVEDEPQVLELAARALRAVGYTVLTAASGAEALEKARGHEGAIDLLITDVVMPQMSGVRLVEQMAEVRPGLGVLYMSGYTDEAIGQHGALDHGAALLPKPFTPAGLGFRVREVLDKAPVN
jgi:PAS domain S-box-containing protein